MLLLVLAETEHGGFVEYGNRDLHLFPRVGQRQPLNSSAKRPPPRAVTSASALPDSGYGRQAAVSGAGAPMVLLTAKTVATPRTMLRRVSRLRPGRREYAATAV